jgi:hypothetical protein
MKITVYFRDDKVEEFSEASETDCSKCDDCLSFYEDGEDMLKEVYIPISSIKYWTEEDDS